MIIRRIRQGLLAALSLIGIFLLVLLLTPMGVPLSYKIARVVLPGELTIAALKGSLLNNLTADELHYKTKAFSLDISALKLDWRPTQLIFRTIYIHRLEADAITFERFDSEGKASDDTPFSLESFSSHTSIVLNYLDLTSLTLKNPDLELKEISATLALNENGLRIRNTRLEAEQFQFDLNGNLGTGFEPNINIEADEKFTFDEVNHITGQIKIQGNLQALTIDQSFDDAIKGSLHAELHDLTEALTVTARGEAQSQNLSLVNYDLGGHVALKLALDYAQATGDGKFSLTSQASEMNESPLDIQISGIIRDNKAHWTNNVLKIGGNEITTSGYYGPGAWRASWDMTAHDLSQITSRLGGSIVTTGSVEMSDQQRIHLTAQGHALYWEGMYLQAINIRSLKLSSQADEPLDVDAIAAGIRHKEITLKQLSVLTTGTQRNFNTNLSLDAYDTQVQSEFRASLEEAVKSFTLKNLNITPANKAVYRLTQPTKFTWENDRLSVSNDTCLLSGASSLCMEWDDDQNQQLTLSAKQLPNEIISAYLHPTLQFSGRFDLISKVTFTQDYGIQAASIDGTLSPGTVFLKLDTTRPWFDFGGGKLKFALEPDSITSRAELKLIDKDFISYDFLLKDWKDVDASTLQARLDADIQNLKPLKFFILQTDDFAGHLIANLRATGPGNKPDYQGELSLKDGRFALPTQGIVIENAQFTAKPHGSGQALLLDGTMTSGPGKVALSGQFEWHDRYPELTLDIQGDRFEVSNVSSALVYASPNLNIKTSDHTLNVSGDLVIPDAKINLKSYESYVGPSPDIIVVQDVHQPKASSWKIDSDVNLILGKDIHLKAGYLTTDLKGKVRIVKQGDDMPRGTGQIETDKAQYKAYGQTLDINKGWIMFNNSPIDNPALNIEVTRKVQLIQRTADQYIFSDTEQAEGFSSSLQEGTVGIRITGTVQNIKFTLFSAPPMSEEDQLSYLLTGAPSNQVGAAQAAFMVGALSEASSALGMSDTDSSRLSSITRSIGLDFNVESGSHIDSESGETVRDTSLVVGKALAPRLYVSYGIGLLDPVNILQVRYQLSRRFAAQSKTTTDGDAGGDILYGVETDSLFGR